jgi:xanthine dehydrogenase accessory factor
LNSHDIIIVRGAGDLATGVIAMLHQAGFCVIATESEEPTCIRRTVSFAETLYAQSLSIEGIHSEYAKDIQSATRLIEQGIVPVMIDPECRIVSEINPDIVVDAIIAKKNLGTRIDMAPLVIALGPGFTAGVDCHYVIETQRGHNLGRVISSGTAAANTGIPGMIGGFGKERVIHSPASGVFVEICKIGDSVHENQTVAQIAKDEGGAVDVKANIPGCLRGLLHGGLEVFQGMKVGDVDPRDDACYCYTISDKARTIAGGVLQLVTAFHNSRR